MLKGRELAQDTVAVEELRFGDNDTLSAQVANLVNADWLILLTDVDYLYTANPNTHPDAQPIKVRLPGPEKLPVTVLARRSFHRERPLTVHVPQSPQPCA